VSLAKRPRCFMKKFKGILGSLQRRGKVLLLCGQLHAPREGAAARQTSCGLRCPNHARLRCGGESSSSSSFGAASAGPTRRGKAGQGSGKADSLQAFCPDSSSKMHKPQYLRPHLCSTSARGWRRRRCSAWCSSRPRRRRRRFSSHGLLRTGSCVTHLCRLVSLLRVAVEL